MISLFEDENASSLIGQEFGVSTWIPITQDLITGFGINTKDPDPAHIDPAWAERHSPFGTTIAFGFLTVSLLTTMLNEIVARPKDEVSTLNYGFDRLRLLSPVPVGSRIRGRFVLRELTLRSPTQFRANYGVTVEIENEDKPALIADWLCVTNVKNPRSSPLATSLLPSSKHASIDPR
ncbi:MAG: MaoC family dehydratase [Proteobacteria bacterium]|nr:MaoC family dehydratase [Pseudomonadota bacterium]